MQPWNQADATDNGVKQIRFHSMCQIRKLFVTAGEGKARLERGQGSPSLPYCSCHLCAIEAVVCVLAAFLSPSYMAGDCHHDGQGHNSSVTAVRTDLKGHILSLSRPPQTPTRHLCVRSSHCKTLMFSND